MNELTKFLVEGILNEETEKVVALFGGGFKPPTKGHLDVVNQGIKQNPEVTKIKILVGGGERNGFTQDQSVKIWNLYNDLNFIDKPAIIIPVSSPFTYYKNYLKDNPDDKVYVFIGSRPDDEKDQMDVKQRSEFVKKYSDNVIPVEVSTTGGVSGTLARKLFKTDIDGFRNMFPENLLDIDFKKILDILNNKSTDNTRKSTPKATEPLSPLNEDPKKGTGKKPKGSGRRLYTDEDPKDTVGIKFSTRQDIVDTLGKKSFKAKSHARQSQIINLIHQRVRAALGRTKDPAKKKKLKSGFEYIKGKKEASKAKTQRLKKQKSKNENIDPKSQSKHKGKSAPFGSAYEPVDEGDTYEKMAAKGKKAGSLKQGTVRKRLKIPKDKKIPLSKINKEISRLKKMDKDKDKKGVQLGDKNQKYYKALQLSKTLKTTTNINEVNLITGKDFGKDKLKEITPIIFLSHDNFKENEIKKLKKDLDSDPYISSRYVGIVVDLNKLKTDKGKLDFNKLIKAGNSIVNSIKNQLKNKFSKLDPVVYVGYNPKKRQIKDILGSKFVVLDKLDAGPIVVNSKLQFRRSADEMAAAMAKNPNFGGGFGKMAKNMNKENLNENATYSSKIDYKQQIKDLTKHMIKKGMNILPLPRVIFKHGDQENASQFLGKTAYYSPSDMTIVLYTEGRHPKDIARSFAHEMVHHIQNLEGRLGGINTTNTNEDDDLNDIEREAYTRGNMIFRNWTDNMDGDEVTSLNEGPQFGVLYHFTEFLLDVLDDNMLRGPVSLTRSKDSFVTEWLGDQPYFILDKDKLRTKYKIRPYKDTSDNPDYEPISYYDEMEEVIDTDVTNLSKYIIKVVLPEPNEEYEDALKEKGIPYEIDKPLNEAIVDKKIECDNCGWSWNIVDGGDDLFICHKCDHDNEPKNGDPFGLKAFARELVNEIFKKSVTIDMDPIIKTLEFEMPTGQETDENVISIIDAAPQGKVPHPVFLDFYAKFDKYFGEENDNRMLDNFGLEYLLSKVLNLPNEDIQIVINHYNTTDQDNIEWFEQHDNELERDEEHNIPEFNDTNDDHESVVNYRRKQLAKSLEEQEEVRIFNPNCGCDKT